MMHVCRDFRFVMRSSRSSTAKRCQFSWWSVVGVQNKSPPVLVHQHAQVAQSLTRMVEWHRPLSCEGFLQNLIRFPSACMSLLSCQMCRWIYLHFAFVVFLVQAISRPFANLFKEAWSFLIKTPANSFQYSFFQRFWLLHGLKSCCYCFDLFWYMFPWFGRSELSDTSMTPHMFPFVDADEVSCFLCLHIIFNKSNVSCINVSNLCVLFMC